MAKKKYYVVWEGHFTGIYDNWDTCKKKIDGFAGAKYKSFKTKELAERAFTEGADAHYGKNTKKVLSDAEKAKFGEPILKSISVDAACSGNPGVMEYQGCFTDSQETIFHKIFEKGTNNIGEFLALVHGLAHLKQQKSPLPLYTDSRTAMSWIAKKKCNTKMDRTQLSAELNDLINRAEIWLKNNTWTTKVLKWETDVWGEIPADFGRK